MYTGTEGSELELAVVFERYRSIESKNGTKRKVLIIFESRLNDKRSTEMDQRRWDTDIG